MNNFTPPQAGGQVSSPLSLDTAPIIPVRDLRTRAFFWAENLLMDVYAPHLGSYAITAYMVLARRADQEQKCWPSYGSIAAMMRCSEPTARDACADLEASGLIRIQPRKSESGQDTSPMFYLLDSVNWRTLPVDELPSEKKKAAQAAQKAAKKRAGSEAKGDLPHPQAPLDQSQADSGQGKAQGKGALPEEGMKDHPTEGISTDDFIGSDSSHSALPDSATLLSGLQRWRVEPQVAQSLVRRDAQGVARGLALFDGPDAPRACDDFAAALVSYIKHPERWASHNKGRGGGVRPKPPEHDVNGGHRPAATPPSSPPQVDDLDAEEYAVIYENLPESEQCRLYDEAARVTHPDLHYLLREPSSLESYRLWSLVQRDYPA